MTTPRVQSETEKALLAIFPEDAAREGRLVLG